VIRLVSGRPEYVQDEVNALLDGYAPLTWSFGVARDEVVVTCLLISEKELQKQRFAAMQLQAAGARPGFKL